MGLFRMGEERAGETHWRWALPCALLVHVVAVGALVLMPASPRPAPAQPEAPEVVFLARLPRAAAAAAAPQAAPKAPAPVARRPTPPHRRQAVLPPRPVAAVQEVPPPPVAPVEPAVAPEAPVQEVAAVGGASLSGVGTAIGGVVGGALQGQAGGSELGVDDAPVEASRLARPPRVLEAEAPRYPRHAEEAGIEGVVRVRIIIGTDGRVESEHSRVVRSIPGLDEAAIAAVNRYRFSPSVGATGKPVRVVAVVPIRFSLR